MIETAVVLDSCENVIYWHEPSGRTSGSIPDSNAFWEFIWQNRASIDAIAHTHPGSGWPHPSNEDLTTFSAIELAIGKRLLWPILSLDSTVYCVYNGGPKYNYRVIPGYEFKSFWRRELRNRSSF